MSTRTIAQACGFSTAKLLLAELSGVLHGSVVGLTWAAGPNHDLLASLYRQHPAYRDYDPPESFVRVDNSALFKAPRSPGFAAVFYDGSLHRFSYRFDRWGKYDPEIAARATIRDRHGSGSGGLHLDHAPPWPFSRILTAWLAGLGREPRYLKLEAGTRFDADDELGFLAFHDARAELRLVPAAVNVARGARRWLKDPEATAEVRALLTTPGIVAIDFETYPTDPAWHGEQATIGIPRSDRKQARADEKLRAQLAGRARHRRACTLQVAHADGRALFVRLADGSDDDRAEQLQAMFAGCQATLAAHNAAFEVEVLLKHGVEVEIDCTLLAAKALYLTAVADDQPQPVSFSLASLVQRELGRTRDKAIRDRDWRDETALDDEAVDYGLQDAKDVLELWQLYRPRLAAEGLLEGYRVMQRTLRANAAINVRGGLMLDQVAHQNLQQQLAADAQRMIAALDVACGRQITNHASTQQVSAWIVNEILPDDQRAITNPDRAVAFTIRLQAKTRGAVKGWRQTETGHLALTRSSKLRKAEQLAQAFPAVAGYLVKHAQWTKLTKLLNAFGPTLARWQDPDGYCRGQFTIWQAWTGRQGCANPNLMNQPRDDVFRALWVAPTGRKLVIADYSQIELRLLAIESGDEVLRQIYRDGRDIHAEVAMAAFDLRPWELTKEDRTRAKAVSFGIAYGSGASGLAEHGGFTLDEAKVLLERVLTAYPGLRLFRQEAPARAAATGWIKIRPNRRVRYDPELSSPTQAINSPIQGGAASVQMIAMRLISDELSGQPELDARLCASVHDEFLVEAPADDRAEIVKSLLVDCMGRALLSVYPEAADIGVARLTEAAAVDKWSLKP